MVPDHVECELTYHELRQIYESMGMPKEVERMRGLFRQMPWIEEYERNDWNVSRVFYNN